MGEGLLTPPIPDRQVSLLLSCHTYIMGLMGVGLLTPPVRDRQVSF